MDTITQFFSENHSQVLHFKPKHTVLLAEEKVENFFYLVDGCIRMTKTNEDGQVITLHIFYPGSCFPLLTLTTDQHNTYDFTALTDVTLQSVPYDQFNEFLQSNMEATYDCLLRMVRGMHGLLQRIENAQSLSAANQITSLLNYFAKHSTETGTDEQGRTLIPLRLTHQDIADWLGLSRENVSIQLKELERDGVIAKQGNLFVMKK